MHIKFLMLNYMLLKYIIKIKLISFLNNTINKLKKNKNIIYDVHIVFYKFYNCFVFNIIKNDKFI